MLALIDGSITVILVLSKSNMILKPVPFFVTVSTVRHDSVQVDIMYTIRRVHYAGWLVFAFSRCDRV